MLELTRTSALLLAMRRGVRMPPEALRAWQGRLLRVAVQQAYEHVPFYRRVWNGARVQPDNIRTIEDLARLPVLAAADVRAAIASGELYSRAVDVAGLSTFASSGTSGPALHVPRSAEASRAWRAAGLRTQGEHGIRWWDRRVQFDAPAAGRYPRQRRRLARTTWIAPALPLDTQIAQLIAADAQVVIGTPTVLRRLCRALDARGVRPPLPRLVIGQGEVLDSASRAAIRRTFEVDPISVYGLTELGYVAWQCEVRRAMHINAELFAVEVLADGHAAAPDTLGRVVITDLRERAVPLLRYDTGDLALAGAASCSCGRTLPTLSPIEGRADRVLHRPDGRRVTSRMIVERLAGILAPDDYRLAQQANHTVQMQVSRRVADRDDVARAVEPLRELLGDVEIAIEAADWPERVEKTEVVIPATAVPPATPVRGTRTRAR